MNILIRWSALVAVVLVAGCASQPKEEPVHQQGWIGGRYKLAKTRLTKADWFFGVDETIACFPKELEQTQKSGVLALALGTNTPAFRAGLRAGDLILEIGRRRVTDLPAFWQTIRLAPPGGSMPVRAYREGRTMDFDVTVGREKYRSQGTFMVGIPGNWEGLHPIPTHDAPNFSLMALGWERDQSPPFEFDSVEQRFRSSCHPKDRPQGSDEEWRCWLAIFQVTKGKAILAQESVTTTQDAPVAR